ncbi:MAG: peptidase M24 [Actinomycetota bacterium]|nr:peptidase M24 [Actinomycetota bacterium]
MSPEVEEKLGRIRGLLDVGLDAVVLRGPGPVAWLSAGGRTHIEATPAVGVAAVVVTADTVTVVTTANEAPRLQVEELGGLEADWQVHGWDAELITALPAGPRVGTDLPYADCRDMSGPLEAARRSLTAAEADRYRVLGIDAATAVTDACGRLGPDSTEHQAAALVAAQLLERGIDPVVLLVAGGDRLSAYRHPLPTGAPVGELVMVVTCARRHGLIVNLTRFVGFRPLDPEREEAYRRLLEVDAAYNVATRTGATVGAIFALGAGAYVRNGFDPAEWRSHHQGGPTGYAPREWLAGAESAAMVEERQPFAWNPSIAGLKCEDTVLAHADLPEILTVEPRWPTTIVAGLARPLIAVW